MGGCNLWNIYGVNLEECFVLKEELNDKKYGRDWIFYDIAWGEVEKGYGTKLWN